MRLRTSVFVVSVLIALLAERAFGQAPDVTDIYVGQSVTTGSLLFRIDPVTGNRTLLEQYVNNTTVTDPDYPDYYDAILVENANTLLKLGARKITRHNRFTGARTIISSAQVGSGPSFFEHSDIARLSATEFVMPVVGQMHITWFALGKVNLLTGDRTYLSGYDGLNPVGTGVGVSWGEAVLVEADGQITVADSTGGNLYRINPATGNRSLLFTAPMQYYPLKIRRLADGNYIAVSETKMYIIDTTSGTMGQLPYPGPEQRINGIQVGPDQMLYIYFAGEAKVCRMNPRELGLTVISSSDSAARVGTGPDLARGTGGALALGLSQPGAAADPAWCLVE